jgi:serine/threonine-protein kinase HipA
LVVLLEGQPIGHIERDRAAHLHLTYAPSYVDGAHRTPLSLSMPPAVPNHTDRAVTSWLRGLLPDNEDVLRSWARELRAQGISPFSLLSTKIGQDCAGAVQFAAPDDVEHLVGRPGSIEWIDKAAVAELLRQLRDDATAWLGTDFGGEFSLGGAQAKTALHRAGDRWGRPSGAMPTTHILKPAIPGFADQEINEHLCLTAARTLGMAAARTELVRFEDQTAVVIERFDRDLGPDGTVARNHQEDLCQALGVFPSDKYQADGGPTPADIAELLRSALVGRAAKRAVEQFRDALIFNWLIAGTDAHAKNYAVLLMSDGARLAPLYDVASYLPYDRSKGHKVKLAMKIGDEYRLLGTDRPGAWQRAARDLRLPYEALRTRLLELTAGIADAFADAAADPSVTVLGSPLPARLTDLIATRAAHCKAALTTRQSA